MLSEYGGGVYGNGVADFTEQRYIVVRVGRKPRVFIEVSLGVAAAPSGKVCHIAALEAR